MGDKGRTERHYLEEELYERVRTDPVIFDFLQAGSLDGVWYWDLENREHEWMSSRFKEVFGYRDDEVPHRAEWWQQHIFEEDLPAVFSNFERHLADPSYPYDQVIRYRHRDGSTVWIRCRGIVLRDDEGRPHRMLGAHTNVTSLMRSRERLASLVEGRSDVRFRVDRGTGQILGASPQMIEWAWDGRRPTFPVPLAGVFASDACRQLASAASPSLLHGERVGNAEPGRGELLIASASLDGDQLDVVARDVSFLGRTHHFVYLVEHLPAPALLVGSGGGVVSRNRAFHQLFPGHDGDSLARMGAGSLAEWLDTGCPTPLFTAHEPFPHTVTSSSLDSAEGDLRLLLFTDLRPQVEAAAELSRARTQTQQILDGLPQLVLCADEVSGELTFVSQSWVERTAQPCERVGEVLRVVHPDDRETLRLAWEGAGGGRRYTEVRLLTAAGSYRWHEVWLDRQRTSENAAASVVTFNDAEERRLHRLQRESQAERLEALLEVAPGAFFVMSRSADGEDELVFESPRFRALFGEPEHRTGEGWGLIDTDYLEGIQQAFDRSAATGEDWATRYPIDHPRRGRIWVEGRATPRHRADGSLTWYGFLVDVTEAKRVEDEMVLASGRLETALSAGGMCTFAAHVEGGVFEWGPRAAEVLGVPDEMLPRTGEAYFACLSPDDALTAQATVEAPPSSESVVVREREMRFPDGQRHWLQFAGRYRETEEGQHLFEGVVQNVTERRKMEHSRARSQRLESIGTLAGGIAHDFNNILFALSGNTAMALSELPPEHPAAEFLEEIRRGSARASELVRRILAFSRPQQPTEESVRARSVVREAIQLLRASAPAMIDVSLTEGKLLHPVGIPGAELHQVVVNLVTNAIQAIGSRVGSITLSLDEVYVSADQADMYADLQMGQYVRLMVRDDGPGMSADVLEHIFDPYYTTKGDESGTGLGLSVVHGLLTSRGGAITAYSAKGKGSRFHVYLPLAGVAEAEAVVEAESGEHSSVRGASVIYVDDEPSIVRVAEKVLAREGYVVRTFTHPLDALRALQRGAPDVLVTDLSMPQLTGIDLIRQVRELYPNLPVVLTTGHLSAELDLELRGMGVAHVVLKADMVTQLGDALVAALGAKPD